jgi:hypothetical protein
MLVHSPLRLPAALGPAQRLGGALFHRLCVLNSTLYAVAHGPAALPAHKVLIPNGMRIESGAAAEGVHLPTDTDMPMATPREAVVLWGGAAAGNEGVSVPASARAPLVRPIALAGEQLEPIVGGDAHTRGVRAPRSTW